MNPLEALKQKLMVKPTVKERERVAVVIKGDEKSKKLISKQKSAIVVENEEKQMQEEPDVTLLKPKTLIIDETKKGYDRDTFLNKLKERKLTKVTMKPILEELEKTNNVIEPVSVLPEEPKVKKAKRVENKKQLIIEEDDNEAEAEAEEELEKQPNMQLLIEEEPEIIEPGLEPEKVVIPIVEPKKKERKTKKVEKGIAVLGPETVVEMGDTDLTKRVPKRSPPINIKVSSYYMNNREIFINFINSLFEPYRVELQNNKDSISCDNIGKTSSDFSLLTHQQIVRDYMNLYTPYRGLLLYHGLGSGKSCTSIAIAEGMKDAKQVIIMTPASLRANYIEELKKCGDLLYKRNQFWEWISTDLHPESAEPISAILNLPLEYIRKYHGAWFINIKKKSNYDDLSDIDRKTLEDQLNEMISQKYKFINYNGLRSKRLEELTSGFKRNLFDNSVVIIDEAHNLISRIVNKLKKEKPIPEEESKKKPGESRDDNIFGEQTPINLSIKLYQMLLRANNARIVLLSGTPVINYPNEFGILFNILRGYIKTWRIPVNVKTSKKIDRNSLQEMLLGEKSLDYLDYSPSSKILTITRNPFGFKNKIKKDSGYQGVSNVKKDEKGDNTIETDYISDDEFEKKIIGILRRNEIEVITDGIEVKYKKALPDKLDEFMTRYVNETDGKIKNIDALKRRIVGLSSYFKSAQENLLPKYSKTLGLDYHIVRIPMSNYQFKIYESARVEERKLEKTNKKKPTTNDVYAEDKASTYRIFSRLFCNFAVLDRPIPERKKKKEDINKEKEKEKEEEEESSKLTELLKDARREESRLDVADENEGEVEGDEVLEKIGGIDYKTRLDNKLKEIESHSNDFLTPDALQTYSPKFLHILENIKDPDYQGLHLVYSQFRTMEGIGIFSLVLEKNGFARFKIRKNISGIWEIVVNEADQGKPTYVLYTGTETTEEKEIVRHIYNGEWDQLPDNISSELKKIANNNNMGEIIKVFMITSSGSEGINLRNTRYVHIMEPYWHPVRLEQVIGRARRICSHKDLPKALQTVEVFVYLMVFTPEQLKSDEAIELKRKDLSKSIPHTPITSDQYLYEISEIKANVTSQLTDAIKESAFDCYIYSNGKCVNFGDPRNDKFSYVPDYADQQNDTTVQANKVAIEWVGKPITLNGVEYVYRRMSKTLLNIYDKASYQAAITNSDIIPLQIGTLEINDKGQQVFKLVT
uniref:Helicase ATP-binding domain-containing protein n=1 Tax=viral metagenome TaxID=1070528 RepID=A0A6C0EQ96_9ZZZZ